MTNVASENATAELRRELETLREQQEAMGRVLRAVARSAGLEPVLDEVVEACTRLCGADAGALWLLEAGQLDYLGHHGYAPNFWYHRENPHPPHPATAAGRTAPP